MTGLVVTEQENFRIGIGIATRGRPEILREILSDLLQQTRQPDRVVVCATAASDVAEVPDGVTVVFAEAGLPRQRNAIIDRLDDCDAVLFLDDDFLMDAGYVATTVAVLRAHPDIVVTTGVTYADGIKGPGIAVAEARAMIAAAAGRPADTTVQAAQHGYGCNMALRLTTARAHAIRFDERLPLYGWSEDVDYTHRLGRYGRIVKLPGANGVHLGVKLGRGRGDRLGYSQVANPIYLFRKGSYSLGRAARSVGRNLAANLARSLRPEAYIDRRGRLRGNGVALLDLLRGRLAPERMLKL